MKIFAVIHNYQADEADRSVFGTGDMQWYEMPESSVSRSGNPFFVPDFDTEFEIFPSVVYRIGRLGKNIAPKFAHRYTDAFGLAAAVVAVNRLKALRADGMPWTEAVCFDRSCLFGNLQPIDTLNNNGVFTFECGDRRIDYDMSALAVPVERVIAGISANTTLKNGDFVLAGLTPFGLTATLGCKLTARHQSSEAKIIDINIR